MKNTVYGVFILFFGSVAIFVIAAAFNNAEFSIAFAVICLAAVVAGESSGSEGKK